MPGAAICIARTSTPAEAEPQPPGPRSAGRATLPAGFGGAALLLKGLVTHPSRAAHVLGTRLHLIGKWLLSGGVVGIVTPWGFGVPAMVLLSSALQQTPLFIVEPFQQVAVTPFVLFGSVSVVIWLLNTGKNTKMAHSPRSIDNAPVRALAGLLGLAMLGGVLYYASRTLPGAYKGNAAATIIPASEAAQLRVVLSHTPAGAEVIASLPISGRFAERQYIYLYDAPASPIPVKSDQVVLVLDTAHTLQFASPAQDASAISYVQTTFRARIIADGADVIAAEWTRPPGQTKVVLP